MSIALGPQDVAKLAVGLDELSIVLVGGQALNLWADAYAASEPALRAHEPFTSADIDFLGTRPDAERCRKVWGGRVMVPNPFDHATPNTAQVETPIFDPPQIIDFLGSINGVENNKLRRQAISMDVVGRGARLLVMHPFHCLTGQLANVYGPLRRREGQEGERHAARVRLAVAVMRCDILHVLDSASVREALRMVEAVAELAHGRDAVAAWRRDGTDVLEAIPAEDERLGKAFLTKRWPQIQAWVAARR